jgi:hypothetical protein
MPHIREAMAGSLRRGVLEILQRRDIASSAADVKNSFSSWDNCMNAAYCKFVSPFPILYEASIVANLFQVAGYSSNYYWRFDCLQCRMVYNPMRLLWHVLLLLVLFLPQMLRQLLWVLRCTSRQKTQAPRRPILPSARCTQSIAFPWLPGSCTNDVWRRRI